MLLSSWEVTRDPGPTQFPATFRQTLT